LKSSRKGQTVAGGVYAAEEVHDQVTCKSEESGKKKQERGVYGLVEGLSGTYPGRPWGPKRRKEAGGKKELNTPSNGEDRVPTERGHEKKTHGRGFYGTLGGKIDTSGNKWRRERVDHSRHESFAEGGRDSGEALNSKESPLSSRIWGKGSLASSLEETPLSQVEKGPET